MKPLTLALLLSLPMSHLALAPVAFAQAAELPALRKALGIDPFAITPYRLLLLRLTPPTRNKLLAELGASPQFADQVLAARLEIDAGQAVPARARLKRAASQLPSDTREIDAFAQLALQAGAYPEAAQASNAGLQRGRTAPRLVTAAIAELRQGRRAEGLALLGELRQKDKTGVAADAAIDAMVAQRMLPEAAELLRAQLEARPQAGAAAQWKQLGDLERQMGHTGQATDALLHALDSEPTPTGRRAIAQGLLRLNREKKALPELLRRLKDAKTAPRLILRGDLEGELGQRAAAVASYEAAAKLDPTDAEPALRLASVAKTPAERADRYAALVAAHPSELRYALELADLRFANKDAAGGKRALVEAGQRLASAPAAQDQIARRLAEHGDAADALVCRERAAALEPRDVDVAFALGDAYRAVGDKVHAVHAYADALTRSDGSRAAWEHEISALERAGYDEELDQRYEEMRKRWPADATLTRRHATALERMKKLERAIALWRELGSRARAPFEKAQADYNVKRLQERKMLER